MKNMEDANYQSLENRVEDLEKGLLRVERALERSQSVEQDAAKRTLVKLTEGKHSNVGSKASKSVSEFGIQLLDRFRNTEGWLGKLGIGLLLFSLVFLFKYAVEQGWLTPGLRVLFGLGLGVVLLLLSTRLYIPRRHFSLLLFGGAIVSFYVTGFAAFQIFNLVPYAVALGFMVAVTVLSFFVSIRQSEAFPALLGVIGGLLTPFLLYVEPGSLPGLVGYTCILISGALFVYYFQGWRPLLWLTFVGGGVVLAFALINGFVVNSEPVASNRLPMQLGLTVAWLLFAILPIAREAIVLRAGSSLAPTVPGVHLQKVSDRTTRYLRQHLNLFSPAVALLAVALSTPIYPMEESTWGWYMLGLALIYASVSYAMKDRETVEEYATSHAMTSLICFTIALALLFDNHELMLVLTLEATLLLVVADRFHSEALRISGHILFFILIFSMLERLFETDLRNMVVLNPRAIVDLILFALALYGSSRLPSVRQRNIYRLVVHLALLVWFVRELDSLEYGQGLITICWGVYAVVLLIAGLHFNEGFLRTLGVGTVLLVVGKLFLVDLATLETLWRILLFLGFGIAFLLLSYFFRTLWRTNEE